MSFASPWWLLALLIVPLALGAAWLWRGRARRYAVRFTAVPALAQAALDAGGGWRSQLPLAALLATVLLLGLALARPQLSHRVPSGDASLMLVLDHSGSMAATDVSPDRIKAAISAANTFVDQLPSSARVGAVGFGSRPDAVQQPVTNHAATRRLLDRQAADGGTDTGDALVLALQLLHGAAKHHPPSAIVLLSDGAANTGPSPITVATEAKQEKIPIYTVALGTDHGVLNLGPFYPPEPVPPDPQLMRQIASISGGRAFDAQTADQLSSIYKSLGSQLSTVERKRDVTLWVLLAAALLALAAAVGSVRSVVRLA